MQRDLPAILFYEDGDHQSPYSHTGNDVVGTALNSDALFLGNVQAAAGTLFTLARPIAPVPIDLRVVRVAGGGPEMVDLQWTGGFPSYDVHRLEAPQGVRDDMNVLLGDLTDTAVEDATAFGALYFYAVEEYP